MAGSRRTSECPEGHLAGLPVYCRGRMKPSATQMATLRLAYSPNDAASRSIRHLAPYDQTLRFEFLREGLPNFIDRVTTMSSTHIRNGSFKFLQMLLNARHAPIILGGINHLGITNHSLSTLQDQISCDRSAVNAASFWAKDALNPSARLVS